jgi:hypothetical protein
LNSLYTPLYERKISQHLYFILVYFQTAWTHDGPQVSVFYKTHTYCHTYSLQLIIRWCKVSIG